MHNHKEDSIFKRASKVLEYTHYDRISKMGSHFFKTFKPKKFETFQTISASKGLKSLKEQQENKNVEA